MQCWEQISQSGHEVEAELRCDMHAAVLLASNGLPMTSSGHGLGCLLMAGSSHRKPPRDNLLRDTLLTLITPDSMKTAPVKARILGAEHELPTAAVVRSSQATPVRWRDNSALEAFGHQHGKWVAEADRKRWRV